MSDVNDNMEQTNDGIAHSEKLLHDYIYVGLLVNCILDGESVTGNVVGFDHDRRKAELRVPGHEGTVLLPIDQLKDASIDKINQASMNIESIDLDDESKLDVIPSNDVITLDIRNLVKEVTVAEDGKVSVSIGRADDVFKLVREAFQREIDHRKAELNVLGPKGTVLLLIDHLKDVSTDKASRESADAMPSSNGAIALNIRNFVKEVTVAEGGKVSVSIGQVDEIFKLVCESFQREIDSQGGDGIASVLATIEKSAHRPRS